jgi:hypothetical protein
MLHRRQQRADAVLSSLARKSIAEGSRLERQGRKSADRGEQCNFDLAALTMDGAELDLLSGTVGRLR